MKIGEEDINHNVMLIIKSIMPWDMCDCSEGDDNLRIMTLGYIQGVCDLANALKEVLKA